MIFGESKHFPSEQGSLRILQAIILEAPAPGMSASGPDSSLAFRSQLLLRPSEVKSESALWHEGKFPFRLR